MQLVKRYRPSAPVVVVATSLRSASRRMILTPSIPGSPGSWMPFALVSFQTRSPIAAGATAVGVGWGFVGVGHGGQDLEGFAVVFDELGTVCGFTASFTIQASVSTVPPSLVALNVPATRYSVLATWTADVALSPGLAPPSVLLPSTFPALSSFMTQASPPAGSFPLSPTMRYPPSTVAMIDAADSFVSASP